MRRQTISIRGLCAFIFLLFISFHPIRSVEKDVNNSLIIPKESFASPTEILYKKLDLEDKLDFSIFERAYKGLQNLSAKNKNILTIVDFTVPSTEKRLYTIDLENKKLLFHSLVAHGRNSGDKYAKTFSNINGSFQSSLGFYVTENTYQGGNGYSLVLNGLEPGINDLAKQRAIVIHGAAYANESFITSTGRLGRSFGCPALPQHINRPLINTIKDGTILYIHADDADYLANSDIIKPEHNTTRLADQSSVEDEAIL
ncbi:MAG TPA: murein L,D-transpeptidase catalytic domain family protein [Sphingobacterium sp.]|nr:murein L,D-transpeptidase catalytic domain family protein [Sphingobacterium sp.]